MQEDVGTAVELPHVFARAMQAEVAIREQLAGEPIDLRAQGAVSGHDQEVAGQLRDGADSRRHVLRGDQRADHQHHRDATWNSEALTPARARREAIEVHPVGDQRAAPARAIALLVERVHADQTVAREEAELTVRAVGGPVAVLRHEDVLRGAIASPRAQSPVEERIATGQREVEVPRPEDSSQVPGEAQLLVGAFVAKRGEPRPALEALPRDAGDGHVAVGAAGAFGARPEDDDLAIASLRQEIGDALERDFRASIDPMQPGQRHAEPHRRRPTRWVGPDCPSRRNMDSYRVAGPATVTWACAPASREV